MRGLKFAALAVVGVLMSSAATASVTINFTNGGGGLAPGEVLIANFDPSTGGEVGGTIVNGSSEGQYAEPAFGDQGDNYLAVRENDPVGATFDFAGGVQSVSFDYGSADEYNSFILCLSGGGCETYSGGDVISASANGDQDSTITNGRVTFTVPEGTLITSLQLLSTQNAGEFDNFATTPAGVPEPGTWGLMLLGFGMIGFAGRRRRRHTGMLAQAV
jgi:PEP-CTERM motif-containing protein